MQFSVLQSSLAAALKRVEAAVSRTSTLPILTFVKLEARGKHLKLMTTDLKMTILARCEAAVEVEGEGCVPFRILSEFVASLPEGRVDLAWQGETATLNVRSARFESHIKGQAGADFPATPTLSGERVEIAAKELAGLIRQVVFAAAKDESRPTLTGVQVVLEGKRVQLMAADGFRMSLTSGTLGDAVETKCAALVPAGALRDLARLLGGDGSVDMVLGGKPNQIAFKVGDTQLWVQLLEGNFPDLQALMPKQQATRAVLKAEEFGRAVKLAKSFARGEANVVRFSVEPGTDFAPGRLVISAVAAELGDQVGEVDATVTGPAVEIAFNIAYVSDWLDAVSANGAQAALELQDSGAKPAVFRVQGDERFVHVLMPMQLERRPA